MIDWKIALDSLRAAQGAADKYSDLPLKQALIAAYDGILTTKEQALAMQEELHAARQRVMELERQLEARAEDPRDGLTFDRLAYWGSEDREHGDHGPFCAHCLDRGVGKRRLVPHGESAKCPECDKFFRVWPENHRPSKPPVPRRGVWDLVF